MSLLQFKPKKKHVLQLEQERAEKLAELGAYLHQLREQQNISLEQVAAHTKIQQRLLNAIEQGRLEHLPEPVYIQGFIKRFAESLGLDGAAFANHFPTGAIPRPIKPSWRSLPAAQLRPMHLYFLYIFLIICAVNGLSSLIDRSPTQASSNNSINQRPTLQLSPGNNKGTQAPPAQLRTVEPDALSNQPRIAAALSSLNLPNDLSTLLQPSANLDASNKPVEVSIMMKADSWIRVVADGKTEFEGVLAEGTQRTWTANERLILKAGNAGGVLVAFNHGQAKQLGNPGSVEEVTFEAKSQAADKGYFILTAKGHH